MPNLAQRISLLMLLFAVAGIRPAVAQNGDYDWLDEDVPEWFEDLGYEDADYGGPDLEAPDEPLDGIGGVALAADGGCRCDCLRCRDRLTGDWHGHRTCLQQRGIIYRGRVTQFFFGVGGGVQPPVAAPFAALGIAGGDQFEYTGNSRHDLLFDTERLLGGPPAGRFAVTLENLWGQFGNVSLETGAGAPTVFNAFMPVDPEAEGTLRVTNFVYVQPLSEQLILSVGKFRTIGVADRNIFAGGDGSDQFINQTFVANPLYVSQIPLSVFAVGAIMPRTWGNISFTVMDPKERSTDFFDLGDLFADGVLMLGQIKVNTNFFGKPGQHHVGGYYKHVDLPDLRFTPRPPTYPYPSAFPGLAGLATKDDSYTIFYGFDQYLAAYEGETNLRGESAGWGVFGRAGISDGADGNPNFSGWHVSLGLGGDSPLKCRRHTRDRFGIAYAFTATSNEWGPVPRALFGPRDAQVIEAYYRYHITPAVSITPDVQWVKGSLGGLTGGDDAFICGLRLNMRL